jgi:AcrR family transcriptional regulator
MIQSALLLIGEQGVEATSFSQVLAHSGAPRGSIYYHFPGGKAQLIEEATRAGGDVVAAMLGALVEQGDPALAVERVIEFWRAALTHTEFSAGCPVVAATLDAGRTPGALEAAEESFKRWTELHEQILERAGVPTARARSLATIFVSSIEGAVVLARAERSVAPLEHVHEELQALIRVALEGVRTPD